ncbi:MAG: hypothetical protein EOO17_03835 [Chloroflexi bacterium]|nr:MAG: hypothetical protein EOO17_03835 [Chloroflexota bacterium]
MPAREDEIDVKVKARYSDFSIDSKGKSNHGRHYVLQKNGETFHLKIVPKTYIEGNQESEIDLLKRVDSEYVVKLIDSGDLDEEWVYLLFPHINGTTLDKMSEIDGWKDEKLLQLLKDTVQGFIDLKKSNIVHRDIKPKNIIYDNINRKFVILDLGIGCFSQGPTKTNTKIEKGTGAKFYTAPEQFKISIGEPYSVSQATDHFSLGVIAYELAMNKHPIITPDERNHQYYATLIFEIEPDRIPETTGVSANIRKVIMKMLNREQSQRFLTNEDLLCELGLMTDADNSSNAQMLFRMPGEARDDIVEFAMKEIDTIRAVLLTPTDGQAICEKLSAAKIPIILDTSVYKLQTDKEQKMMAQKLKIPYAAQHNMLTLSRLKEKLIIGAWELSDKMYSEIAVLPYFKVEGDESLLLTKEMWVESQDILLSNGYTTKKVYGGIVIPHSTIINQAERAKFLSTIMGSFNLDGLLVNFENSSSKAHTTVDEHYLEGLKEIIHFLESQFKDVIINQTDISALPLLSHSSYVVGWPKSFRHFQSGGSGGGNGNNDYKMKYYVPNIFTFIEEKTRIQTIIGLGKGSYLECSCEDCAVSDPLDSSYDEDETRERGHYFSAMVNLQKDLIGKTLSERNNHFKNYLTSCQAAAADIKSTGAITSKTIPSYERFVTLIND